MIKSYLQYKNLLHDFSYMYLIIVIQKILALVVTYYMVRVLSQTQFAEYNLIIGYISLLTAFTLPGLGNAVMQSTARQASGVYIKAQKYMFAGAVLAGLVLLFVAYLHQYRDDDSRGVMIGLCIVALLFPLFCGLTIWKPFRVGLKKFKDISILDNFSQITTYVFILILLLSFKEDNYLPLIFIYMFVPAVLNLVMFSYDKFHALKEKSHEQEEDNILSYGLKTSLYAALHTVAMRLDYFILFYLVSPQMLAIFAVANRIPEVLREVTQTLCAVLAPRFATLPYLTPKMKKMINIYSFVFGAGVIIATFTIYPYFMQFLFGEQYQDAIIYSQAIMCSLVIGNLANIEFRYIRSQKDAESFRLITIIISVVRITCVIVFIPMMGIWGVVVSIFAYRLSMMAVVKYIIYQKYSADREAV